MLILTRFTVIGRAGSARLFFRWVTEARIRAALAECKFVRIGDVQPSVILGFVANLRNDRLNGGGYTLPRKCITTTNYYIGAIKSFARWLWKDRRIVVDLLASMSKLDHK
jgi:hypothetical protein